MERFEGWVGDGGPNRYEIRGRLWLAGKPSYSDGDEIESLEKDSYNIKKRFWRGIPNSYAAALHQFPNFPLCPYTRKAGRNHRRGDHMPQLYFMCSFSMRQKKIDNNEHAITELVCSSMLLPAITLILQH